MNTKTRALFFLLLTLVILVSFTSCSPKPIGYGVLLWRDEQTDFSAGQIVPVYYESNIRNAYLTAPEGEVGHEIPRWRMELLDSEEKAESFLSNYSEYLKVFGDAMVNGLAVRSEPNTSSERVYKLRAGQSVKIVEKLPDVMEIAGETGNWFRVLTGDGIDGYCFGPNLDLYDADVRASQAGNMELDPALENFLSKPFRPKEFQEMLREQRVDLSKFKQNIGVFPDTETKSIFLATEEGSINFVYDDIVETGDREYTFGDSGLNISIITSNKVILHYIKNGDPINKEYVALDGMTELIQNEKDRRTAIHDSLIRMDSGTSNAYGSIAFTSNYTFTWEGFERLTPDVIPHGAIGYGRKYEFKYFPFPGVASDYEGILTFNFAQSGSGVTTEINFFYQRTDKGLRLVHIPNEDIKDDLVQRVSPSPVVMFFTAAVTPYIETPDEEQE